MNNLSSTFQVRLYPSILTFAGKTTNISIVLKAEKAMDSVYEKKLTKTNMKFSYIGFRYFFLLFVIFHVIFIGWLCLNYFQEMTKKKNGIYGLIKFVPNFPFSKIRWKCYNSTNVSNVLAQLCFTVQVVLSICYYFHT